MSMEFRSCRIMRLREVCGYVGISRSTLYRKLAEGTFPVPLRLGSRAVGWRTKDVVAWLEDGERRWDPSEVR